MYTMIFDWINTEQSPVPEPDFIVLFAKTIIMLAVVCLLMYGMMCFLKKYMRAPHFLKNETNSMRVITVFHLEPGKKLLIMKILNMYYLLACTQSSIQLLRELAPEEVENALNVQRSEQYDKRTSFLSFLNYIKKKK